MNEQLWSQNTLKNGEILVCDMCDVFNISGYLFV